MNERIAKLYDQAIVIEDGGDYVCGELDPVKFAQLIIKECTLQIADVRIEHDFDPTVDEVLVQALTGIKKHFGVEE